MKDKKENEIDDQETASRGYDLELAVSVLRIEAKQKGRIDGTAAFRVEL